MTNNLAATNGGTLSLVDTQGKTIKTLITAQPKNGQDITISLAEEKIHSLN